MKRFTIVFLKLIFSFLLLQIVTSEFAVAHICGPDTIRVKRTQLRTYVVSGSVPADFTVVGFGDSSIARISPPSISNSNNGTFVITGNGIGSTVMAVYWKGVVGSGDNSEGTCFFTVIVENDTTGRTNAASYFNARAKIIYPDAHQEAWGFLGRYPLPKGTTVQSHDGNEFSVTLNTDKWFGWIDYQKNDRFAHTGSYVFIDAQTMDVSSYPISWWPEINGTPWLAGLDERMTTIDRTFGTLPPYVVKGNVNTVVDSSGAIQQPDSVCALLVSGEGDTPRQQQGFDNDVDLIKGNLQRERLGVRLSDGNIWVRHNVSHQELLAKIDSMRGRYKKIYFFYSGHGNYGGFWPKDSSVTYETLANKLFDTGAEEITVLLDACESGSAVPWFSFGQHDNTKVTVLTSSANDSSSWGRIIVTGNGDTVRYGEYAWAFALCYGNLGADKDSDGQTSFVETFNWVREVNPDLSLGQGKMNMKMDPQLYVRTPVPASTPVVNVPDADVTIFQEDSTRPLSTYSVSLKVGLQYRYTIDPSVTSISPYRTWEIHLSPPESVRVNIRFQYDLNKDFLSIQGNYGLVTRPDSSIPWIQYQPTIWDSSKKWIIGLNVHHFSEWALATVTESTLVGVENNERELPLAFALHQNYPNPFNPSTNIEFRIPARPAGGSNFGFVSLKVYDVLGREVATLVNEVKPPGEYTLAWDAANMPSGVYFYRLQAGTFVQTRKLILIR